MPKFEEHLAIADRIYALSGSRVIEKHYAIAPANRDFVLGYVVHLLTDEIYRANSFRTACKAGISKARTSEMTVKQQ